MYNRYVPDHNGNYERHIIADSSPQASVTQPQKNECEVSTPPEKAKQQKLPEQPGRSGFDLGDLLLLCIVILLLIDSDEDDIFPILITAAAFLLQP